ncbi:uncharacterized protein [Battus philenor]|uniref:uncharacterized protein n=1 Tax=Battus philenor TaxID=42288 RepID=UPI0035CF11A7
MMGLKLFIRVLPWNAISMILLLGLSLNQYTNAQEAQEDTEGTYGDQTTDDAPPGVSEDTKSGNGMVAETRRKFNISSIVNALEDLNIAKKKIQAGLNRGIDASKQTVQGVVDINDKLFNISLSLLRN